MEKSSVSKARPPLAEKSAAAGENKKLAGLILTEKELLEGGEMSIIRLVDALLRYAYRLRASDIHIDPETTKVRVRLRIDGVLHDTFIFSKEWQSEIITRLKVLSGLRTDEHQAAQDCRFKFRSGKNSFDVRVSITPTYYAENAVMRLLAEPEQGFSLESLGFSEKICSTGSNQRK